MFFYFVFNFCLDLTLILLVTTNLHLSAGFPLQANNFHPGKLVKRAERRETWLWPDVQIISCIIPNIRWLLISQACPAHFYLKHFIGSFNQVFSFTTRSNCNHTWTSWGCFTQRWLWNLNHLPVKAHHLIIYTSTLIINWPKCTRGRTHLPTNSRSAWF